MVSCYTFASKCTASIALLLVGRGKDMWPFTAKPCTCIYKEIIFASRSFYGPLSWEQFLIAARNGWYSGWVDDVSSGAVLFPDQPYWYDGAGHGTVRIASQRTVCLLLKPIRWLRGTQGWAEAVGRVPVGMVHDWHDQKVVRGTFLFLVIPSKVHGCQVWGAPDHLFVPCASQGVVPCLGQGALVLGCVTEHTGPDAGERTCLLPNGASQETSGARTSHRVTSWVRSRHWPC